MKIKYFVFLILMAFQFSASASPVTLRWGVAHDLYYHRKIANQFKEEIEKKTNGRIKIKVETFDSNKVIKSAHEFVEKNKYEICQDIIGNFENIAPEAKVWEVPFLFRDFAHAEKYILSANAEKVLEKINQKDPTLHAIAYSFSGGPLVIYSPEKLNSMHDLKGKEFSIGVNFGFDANLKKELNVTTKREDGKKIVKIGEELGAAMDGLFSVYEDPLSMWMNITTHRFVTRLVFVSKKALAKVSKEDQEIFLSSIKNLMVEERRYSAEAMRLAIEVLKNRGANLNIWTPEQVAEGKKMFSSYTESLPPSVKSEAALISSY